MELCDTSKLGLKCKGDFLTLPNRLSKRQSIEKRIAQKNLYLKEHQRAEVSPAAKEIRERIARLKLDKWLHVQEQGRALVLEVLEDFLAEEARLDGCYVIKTDLPGGGCRQTNRP